MLGRAIQSISDDSPHEILPISRKRADLSDPVQVRDLIRASRPDCIVHGAAVVAGIELNRLKPEYMYEQNAILNEAVLTEAAAYGVPRVLSFLSTCVFPPDAPQPWTEDLIQVGEVDSRHWGYAKAKRELDRLSAKLTDESGGRCQYSTLTPSTLYGPGDYYGPDRSHVLAALILKFHLAARTGEEVLLWGSGTPRREFLFSQDLARVVLWAVDHYNEPETMIVSPETDTSISELAEIIGLAIGFDGIVKWDTSRPDGTPSRSTLSAKLAQRFNIEFTAIEVGVAQAIEDFRRNFPNFRGWNAGGSLPS